MSRGKLLLIIIPTSETLDWGLLDELEIKNINVPNCIGSCVLQMYLEAEALSM